MLSRGSAGGAFLPLVFALLAATCVAKPADDKTATAPNNDARPVLVELFTSEGCSSCPPADIMIQTLDQYQPVPGAHLIVLSEHVTYWDHDGWRDPNSSPALTDRQSAYETVLGEKSPYTPQIIVDGSQIIRIDQSQQQMDELFSKAAAAPKIPVRIGDLTIDPGNPAELRARIETGDNPDDHDADVYVALALDHVESQVLRGENGGKHLVHVAVVQELTRIGRLPKGKSFARDVKLKLKPGTDPKNLRLVAFVQTTGPGKVLGSALRKTAN